MSQNSENQGSNAVTFDYPKYTVCCATGNAHKLVEIEAILLACLVCFLGGRWLGPGDFP